jgi:hypothetical protein
MTNQNYFSKKFEKKTADQLEYMIQNESIHDPRAVQAAIWELEKRGLDSEYSKKVQEALTQKKVQAIEDDTPVDIGIPVKTVSGLTRFLHCVIDAIAMLPIHILLELQQPNSPVNFSTILLSWLVFYVFFESIFQKTPAKMIMGTIVIDKNGKKPGLAYIILRTFVRFVPFEFLSCFGTYTYAWHDKWSGTYVIHKRDLKAFEVQKEAHEHKEEG